jgi:hypothetical protein
MREFSDDISSVKNTDIIVLPLPGPPRIQRRRLSPLSHPWKRGLLLIHSQVPCVLIPFAQMILSRSIPGSVKKSALRHAARAFSLGFKR